MVENQLVNRIKIFLCDGSKELVEGDLKCVLDNFGIYLRLSCPHIHEQNGLAERKIGHIKEMGPTMLFQASLPRSLCLEAFSIAIYLIIHLPTPVLGDRLPFEALFGSVLDHNHLRVFGCAYYPHLVPYRKDKLSPKSTRCIFLGYSSKLKGYRCLDSSSGRIYISFYVILDESSFPFADNTSFNVRGILSQPCDPLASGGTSCTVALPLSISQASPSLASTADSCSTPECADAPMPNNIDAPSHSIPSTMVAPPIQQSMTPLSSTSNSIYPMMTLLAQGSYPLI